MKHFLLFFAALSCVHFSTYTFEGGEREGAVERTAGVESRDAERIQEEDEEVRKAGG